MAKTKRKKSAKAPKKTSGAKKAPQETKKTKTQEAREAAARAKAELEASKKGLDDFAESHEKLEKGQDPPERRGSRDLFPKLKTLRAFNLRKCFGTGLLLLSAVGLCMLTVTTDAVLGVDNLTTLMGQICHQTGGGYRADDDGLSLNGSPFHYLADLVLRSGQTYLGDVVAMGGRPVGRGVGGNRALVHKVEPGASSQVVLIVDWGVEK